MQVKKIILPEWYDPDKYLFLQLTLIDLSDLYHSDILTFVQVRIIMFSELLAPNTFLSLHVTLMDLVYLLLFA